MPHRRRTTICYLLLNQHTVSLGRVLLLRHVHALLVAQRLRIGEDELPDRLRELHELGLLEDEHLDAVPAAGLVDEVELRAHRVRQVRGGEQDEQYPDRRTVRQACEARDEEHDAPDERSGVELRVRVHGRDVAQRDRLRGRSERDHTQQGVRALVYHAHAARGDAGPEPEQDHGRAEPVADDAGLPRRVGEFGHGLLCFGHFSFLSLVFIAKVEDDAAILVDDERGVEFAALP